MADRAIRRWAFFTAGFGLLALLMTAAVLMGPAPLAPGKVVRVLLSRLLPGGMLDVGDLTRAQIVVVWDLRLPRAVVGALVGAALAGAGAVMQALFRNPLAEPGLTGASAGAALGAVLAFALGWSSAHPVALPVAAMSGSLAALVAVYAMSARGGVAPVARLLLSGVAVSSLLSAGAGLVLSLQIHNWQVAQEMVFWTMGGLEARTWTHVWLCAPFSACGLVFSRIYAAELDLLQQGEETAASLGVDVEGVKRLLMACAAAMTGAAVSVAGMIGFVGLVTPHAVRLLLGPAHRVLLPASALAGAIFLLTCDLLARTMHSPGEIRLGVVTSLIGGPLFIYLLLRRNWEAGS